ncbi:excalibur calcium-binding domain-containing protein [Sphingobium sp. TCM1]|uniref:excalibur calcium-binding domain-containing protein n=1 Tax=Sphingobium sp. TCM1 TaxID=453246 RepID=UPI000A9C0999|nr:excalibur calcium-binding domain-containing protein [Sphingobium sp. TCM1]
MSFKKPFRAVPVRHSAHYAAQRRKRRQVALAAKVAAGTMLAAAVGAGSFFMQDRDVPAPVEQRQSVEAIPYTPPHMMSAEELDAQQPSSGTVAPQQAVPAKASGSSWSYPNCRAARAAGAAPLYAGQPGYGPHMDGDGDGIACEPYRGQR